MSAFDDTRSIEAAHMPAVKAWFERDGYTVTAINDMMDAKKYQTEYKIGDLFIVKPGRPGLNVEVKMSTYPDTVLFLETWSNKSRATPGWMTTSVANVLLFYKPAIDTILWIPFRDPTRGVGLKSWFKEHGGDELNGKDLYREVCQQVRRQRNDTWGRLVEWPTIAAAVETATEYTEIARAAA